MAKAGIALFWIALLLGLLPSSALAQGQTTGRIAGTVKDQRGGLIVGAGVEVTSETTAEVRKVTTDDQGNYNVPLLAPGAYRLTVTSPGFALAVFEPVQVVITETTSVDVELAPAGPDTLPVRVDPLMQIDGPQLGRVVNSRAVSELPLATRNFTQILALSPGTSVSLPDNTGLGRNSQNVSVNGARVTQNDFEINGIDANNLATNAAALVAVPAPESIQEFKVQTSLYAATFGRGGGGNVQALTKSGSNRFHGAAYEYFRHDALNANNPFLKAAGVARPTLQRNVFGGLLGGPIKADRLFFFGSYQGTREDSGASPNSLTSSVLIAPGLTDDRSQQTLLNTFRPRLSPTSPPATSIHPSALALLNTRLPDGQFLIPTPQADGHYSGSAISTYREDQFNANLDYRINEKSQLALRVFFSNAPQFLALPTGAANVPGFGADQEQNNRLISVQSIHIFSPRTTNEARIGYSYIRGDMTGQNPVRDSDLGIKRANANVYPGLGSIRIGPTGTNAVSIGNAGQNVDTGNVATATTLVDVLSIVRGAHSFRTGAQIIYYRNDLVANNNRRGTIVFQSFNNFLLGSANNSVYGDGIGTRNLRAADFSFFVQDDWKVSPRLTLNLGLRYELDLPPYETHGAMSTFDPALYRPRMEVDAAGNPIGPPTAGFVQAGNVIAQYDLPEAPNVGKRVLAGNDPNNFGPRFGFAYAPGDSGRLVVRGGYGIFYSRPSTAYIGIAINAPPMYTVRRSPAGAAVPLADPFFPLPSQNQFPAFVRGVSLAGQIFDRDLRAAYFQHYNASVQHILRKDLLLEVAYVGTRGVNLIRDIAINQARLASPQRPIINAVTGQVVTTNTPAATNVALRAPFQGVEVGSFLQIQSTAQSTYNSLQISLTRRFSKGLQFLASYTYAKSIDNASGGSDSTGDVRDTVNIAGNQLDNRANRGVSDFDRGHRFVLSGLWDLPRPPFARSTAGRFLFSNWQLATIVTAMSGLPIDIIDGGAGSFYGLSGGNNAFMRPSWAPGATTATATSNIPPGYFFNPLAFVRPVVLAGRVIPSSNGTAVAGATGTDFGNVGRNVLRGPGQYNVDLSVIRRFPFHDTKNLEFRAEVFNLFNHVNLANPISNLSAVPATSVDSNTGRIIGSPGDFGRIVSTSNNPRMIQFAVKLNF
ncbi:MAG TPA: TonB-dependent receptor [Pyrinomonadaceae bacterium]|nr:TonB-dependent receptor [Pyrinomonadaceae bacterium]